jgi:hypothetical protein
MKHLKINNMKKESKGKEINNRINLLLWIIGISFGFIIWLSIIIAFNV